MELTLHLFHSGGVFDEDAARKFEKIVLRAAKSWIKNGPEEISILVIDAEKDQWARNCYHLPMQGIRYTTQSDKGTYIITPDMIYFKGYRNSLRYGCPFIHIEPVYADDEAIEPIRWDFAIFAKPVKWAGPAVCYSGAVYDGGGWELNTSAPEKRL